MLKSQVLIKALILIHYGFYGNSFHKDVYDGFST